LNDQSGYFALNKQSDKKSSQKKKKKQFDKKASILDLHVNASQTLKFIYYKDRRQLKNFHLDWTRHTPHAEPACKEPRR